MDRSGSWKTLHSGLGDFGSEDGTCESSDTLDRKTRSWKGFLLRSVPSTYVVPAPTRGEGWGPVDGVGERRARWVRDESGVRTPT